MTKADMMKQIKKFYKEQEKHADKKEIKCIFCKKKIPEDADPDDNWIDIAGYAACGGEISGGSADGE